MKFLIVNGPNINMLGVREPDIYGTLTYEGLCSHIAQAARGMGVEAEFFQSNCEGDIVTAIQGRAGPRGRHRHQPRGLHAHLSGHSGRAEGSGAARRRGAHLRRDKARSLPPAKLCGHGLPLSLRGRGQRWLCARHGDAEARYRGQPCHPARHAAQRMGGLQGGGRRGCAAAGGGFLHCSPVEYFWRVAPGHYADGGDYVLLCIDVKKGARTHQMGGRAP